MFLRFFPIFLLSLVIYFSRKIGFKNRLSGSYFYTIYTVRRSLIHVGLVTAFL